MLSRSCDYVPQSSWGCWETVPSGYTESGWQSAPLMAKATCWGLWRLWCMEALGHILTVGEVWSPLQGATALASEAAGSFYMGLHDDLLVNEKGPGKVTGVRRRNGGALSQDWPEGEGASTEVKENAGG